MLYEPLGESLRLTQNECESVTPLAFKARPFKFPIAFNSISHVGCRVTWSLGEKIKMEKELPRAFKFLANFYPEPDAFRRT